MSELAHPARAGRIQIQGVGKRFGSQQVLKDIDLTIEPGKVTVILGPSGSGKSTLLRTINHLEKIDSGYITIDGDYVGYRRKGDLLYELKEREILKRRIEVGFVFQNFNLFPHLTAWENIAEAPLAHKRWSKAQAQGKAGELLARVGLADKVDAYPRQLSGGQQQRVAIARALVYEPRILLMDEPLGALDKKLREDLQDELRQLHRRLGITIVYVTHDQEEAMRLSQRIAIFSHGKIVGLGTGYDLYQNPPNAFVASFLGNSNFLKLKAQGNAVATFEGSSLAIRLTSNLKTDQDVLLMVRPEKAQALSVAQAAATPLEAGWNEVSATVTEVLFLGESQTCSVVTTGGTAMTVKALSATGMPLKAADPVRVRWAAADACIYTEWTDSDLNKAAGAH